MISAVHHCLITAEGSEWVLSKPSAQVGSVEPPTVNCINCGDFLAKHRGAISKLCKCAVLWQAYSPMMILVT